VSDDDGHEDEEEMDKEDFRDFIDDQPVNSSSRQLDLHPPVLDANENVPLFQHIFDRYENRPSSSTSSSHVSHPSSSALQMSQLTTSTYNPSDTRVPSPTRVFSSAHAPAPPSPPPLATPSACWDVLRKFAASEITLSQLEAQLDEILGDTYNDTIWRPRIAAIMEWEDDWLSPVVKVAEFEAEEEAARQTQESTRALGILDALHADDGARATPSSSGVPSIASEQSDLAESSSTISSFVYNDGALVSKRARTEQDALDDAMNAIRVHYRGDSIDWRWYRVQCMVCHRYFLKFVSQSNGQHFSADRRTMSFML
jgi:hypothetical protein